MQALARVVHPLHCAEREQHGGIRVETYAHVRYGRHADDRQIGVVHPDRAADRIFSTREQLLPDSLGNHADLALLLHVDFVEETAEQQPLRQNLLETRGIADDRVGSLAVVAAEIVGTSPEDASHGFDARYLGLDDAHVVVVELPVASGRQSFVRDRRLAAPQEAGVLVHAVQVGVKQVAKAQSGPHHDGQHEDAPKDSEGGHDAALAVSVDGLPDFFPAV